MHDLKDTNTWSALVTGKPQGLVLGPVLFNIFLTYSYVFM